MILELIVVLSGIIATVPALAYLSICKNRIMDADMIVSLCILTAISMIGAASVTAVSFGYVEEITKIQATNISNSVLEGKNKWIF